MWNPSSDSTGLFYFLFTFVYIGRGIDEDEDEEREGFGCLHTPDVRIKVPELELQTAGTKSWKNVTFCSPLQHTHTYHTHTHIHTTHTHAHTPLHLSLHPVPQECKNTQNPPSALRSKPSHGLAHPQHVVSLFASRRHTHSHTLKHAKMSREEPFYFPLQSNTKTRPTDLRTPNMLIAFSQT